MSCATRHSRDDILLGEPLCPDCYDYTGSVLFNACAPELWRRFAITLLKHHPAKDSLTGKMKSCMISTAFLGAAADSHRLGRTLAPVDR